MLKELKKGACVKIKDGSEATIIEKLGEGGQGSVYRVSWNSKEYALKWYLPIYLKNMKERNKDNVKEFYENLAMNAANGAPSKDFLWPIAVTEKVGGRFGYIMDLYPQGFVSFTKFLNAKVHFKNTLAVINATKNMVNAFQALHRQGYSYQDINDGNFFVNPDTGDILICDNDNVAPHGKTFGIAGKSRYMAPEIVLGKEKPNARSDEFSLSVILFMFYFLSHPLEGKRVVASPCLTDKLERKFYAEDPVFIWDYTDTSNRPVRGIHNNAINLWPLFPSYLQDAFNRVFSEGAKDLSKRYSDQEWKKLFNKLRNDMFSCPKCGEELFASMAVDENIKCFECKSTVNKPLQLSSSRINIALYPGKQITVGDLSSDSDDRIIASVVQNKKQNKLLGLRNMSPIPWLVTMPNGDKKTIETEKVVPLVKNVEIDFGEGKSFSIK